MPHIIIISPSAGVLITLKELLQVLSNHARNLNWHILDVHGTGATGLGAMVELEARVQRCLSGLAVSWGELAEFSEEVDDLYDGLFAGYEIGLSTVIEDSELIANATMALQLHDSTFWQCFFREESEATSLLKKMDTALASEDLLTPWTR